jgi:hypothetical protein
VRFFEIKNKKLNFLIPNSGLYKDSLEFLGIGTNK